MLLLATEVNHHRHAKGSGVGVPTGTLCLSSCDDGIK